jgi:hypothetical protein
LWNVVRQIRDSDERIGDYNVKHPLNQREPFQTVGGKESKALKVLEDRIGDLYDT